VPNVKRQSYLPNFINTHAKSAATIPDVKFAKMNMLATDTLKKVGSSPKMSLILCGRGINRLNMIPFILGFVEILLKQHYVSIAKRLSLEIGLVKQAEEKHTQKAIQGIEKIGFACVVRAIGKKI